MHRKLLASWCICALVVLLLSSGASAVYESKCEGLECSINTGLGLFTFDIYGSRLRLIDSAGNFIPDSTDIGIGFSHLVERRKNVTDASTESFKCVVPDTPFINSTKKGQGGELINIFEFGKLPVTLEHLVDYPFEGVVSLRYTYSFQGSPVFIQTFSVADRNFSYILSNDTRFTGGTVPTATYTDGGLKITVEIPDMPWQAPDSGAYFNSSFATVYINFTMNFNDNDLVNLTNAAELILTAVNKDKGYAVQYSFENAFFIDGVAYAGHVGQNDSYSNLPGYAMNTILHGQSEETDSYYMDLTICKDIADGGSAMAARWRNLSYDPNLLVLFSDGVSTPASTKQRRAVNIAVAVVVPVVLVAVLCVVLIVLFVPAVYIRVLPSDPLRKNRLKIPKPADDELGGARGRSETKAAAPASVKVTKSSGAAVSSTPVAAPAVVPEPVAQPIAPEDPPRSTWNKSRKPDL